MPCTPEDVDFDLSPHIFFVVALVVTETEAVSSSERESSPEGGGELVRHEDRYLEVTPHIPYLGQFPLFFKAIHIYHQALLFSNQSSEIHWESVRIIEEPSSVACTLQRTCVK